MSGTIHVLLVDDHSILREGLKTLLDASADVQVISFASTAQEGLTKALGVNAQVAVIDLSLPDRDGLWLLEQIQEKKPSLKVIVLSMHSDPETVVKVLSHGASGYLTKSAECSELLVAIRAVHQGGSYIQPQIAPYLLGALREPGKSNAESDFGDKERDLLARLASGQSNQQIATDQFISTSTVKANLRVLFRKLGVSTRTEVVVEAMRRGLISETG